MPGAKRNEGKVKVKILRELKGVRKFVRDAHDRGLGKQHIAEYVLGRWERHSGPEHRGILKLLITAALSECSKPRDVAVKPGITVEEAGRALSRFARSARRIMIPSGPNNLVRYRHHRGKDGDFLSQDQISRAFHAMLEHGLVKPPVSSVALCKGITECTIERRFSSGLVYHTFRATGYAFCSPRDQYCRRIGRQIALDRAEAVLAQITQAFEKERT